MLHFSHTFGQLLAQTVDIHAVDLIVPMPMHPTRLEERGINQALEIAKTVSKPHQEKHDYKKAIRQKLTSLPLKAGVKYMRGVFQVDADLTGKRIAIIDDVMTTGESLN